MNHEAPLAGTKRGFWNQHAEATRVGLEPISTGYCPTLQAAALHLEGVMSFQAIAWAFKQPAKTAEKFLLIAVSNYADEQGHAWPSVERLSLDTGMSRATVKRGLKRLEDGGYISRHKRLKGHLQTSNLYVLKGRFS